MCAERHHKTPEPIYMAKIHKKPRRTWYVGAAHIDSFAVCLDDVTFAASFEGNKKKKTEKPTATIDIYCRRYNGVNKFLTKWYFQSTDHDCHQTTDSLEGSFHVIALFAVAVMYALSGVFSFKP